MSYPGNIGDPRREITGVDGFATKGVIPSAMTKTGTYTTVGKIVTGIGTVFTDDIDGTWWLYSDANNEVRRIINIYDNTCMYLERAFTADVSVAETLKVVRLQELSVSCRNIGALTGTYMNRPILTTDSYNNAAESGLTPVTYDAASPAATTLEFLITRIA